MQIGMNPNPTTHPIGIHIQPDGGSWQDVGKGSAINDAVKANAHVSVDEAIARLESEIRYSHDMSQLDKDPAIMCLAALKRTREDIRKRKMKRFGFWVMFILFSCIGFFIAKGYVAENTVIGTHVTTKECTIPWGKDQLVVTRHFNYPSKTLFGYQILDKSHPDIQDEITLPGDAITILGADDRSTEKNPNGKWWRENYTKGEFGTRKLKYADQIWFVGEKDKTALTSRNSFCK